MAQTTFAERLAKLLKQQGITQKELAERVGVTEATMSRYMHSERIPKSEIIRFSARNRRKGQYRK